MDRLAIGRITGRFGICGELKLTIFSGETGHLIRLKEVFMLKAGSLSSYGVESVKPAGRGVRMKLAGVDTPQKADLLKGLEVWVERAQACPLGEGEYYQADLCRCRVFTHHREVGRVRSICAGAQYQLLEIVTVSGELRLIPFAGPFIGEVDIEKGRIDLKEEALIL